MNHVRSGFVVNRGTSTQYDEVASAATPFPVQVISTSVTSNTVVAFIRGNKAPAAIATPEALAADNTFVTSVTLWAQRGSRVANNASVYVDAVGTNDAQQIEMSPGGTLTLTAPAGRVIDLNDIYVDSTDAGDGVFYLGWL